MTIIGSNNLPKDINERLSEFLDYLDTHYEVDTGSTALYWELSYIIASRVGTNGDD